MNSSGSLSLTKILSGLSKGLGLINQAIPIYKEVKPMVSNAKKVLSIVREINKPSKSEKGKDVKIVKEIKKEKTVLSNNNPIFFV